MARKIIDIGVVGNDGTGDSIRDSFRKVNDNFRELYSSLGLGENLTFIGLDDTPGSYQGQNDPDTGNTPVLTINNNASGIQFKKIMAGSGIALDFTTNPNEITISSEFSQVVGDSSPQLGGDLSARSGGQQHRIVDLGTNTSPLLPVYEHEATSKGYVDTKISKAGTNAIDPRTGLNDTSFGVMTGPLILARDPLPDDDTVYDGLIAATKRYVDNAAFGSSVNLYVATSGEDDRIGVSPEIQGRALAYAYRSLEAALKRAEEIMLESRLEIGPYKKILTYNNGANECTLELIDDAPSAGAGFSGQVLMSVDTIEVSYTGVNYLPGDIITLAGGTFVEPARYEVLSTSDTPGGVVTVRQLSSGVYTVLPGSTSVDTTSDSAIPHPDLADRVKFNVTYKVNNVQVISGGSGYGLVSVRIVGGGGSGSFGTADVSGGVVQSITITDQGSGFVTLPVVQVSLPRFYLKTEGQRTDFTGDVLTSTPEAVRTRDLREGLYLRGETSGALAQILSHSGELDSGGREIFDVDIKYGSFDLGEVIAYGDVAKDTHITVLVESGIYYENLPLRVPINTSIVGDEFRRCIIRPKPGISSSPWAFLKFRRDLTIGEAGIDQITIADRLFGWHYLTDSSQAVYPLINNKGFYRSAAQLLVLNRFFLQKEVVGWIQNQVTNNIAPFTSSFTYSSSTCERDVGLLIDAMVFDLRYGSSDRTVSAALKYYSNASGLIAIGAQLDETKAAIRRLGVLAQAVIRNVEITERYQQTFPQIVDGAFIAETGAGGTSFNINGASISDPVVITTAAAHGLINGDNIIIDDVGGMTAINGNDYFVSVLTPNAFRLYNDSGLTDGVDGTNFSSYTTGGTAYNNGGVIGALINVIIDVIDESGPGLGSVNTPKNNDQMDVFLCNDSVRFQAITCQGHGGFFMVLDPAGQILAKSPYAQECASFSKSTGRQTFAGGQFIDGFTGNIKFELLGKRELGVSGMISGRQYTIKTVGTTNFTTIGATDNNIGTVFRYNGVLTSGTGIVEDNSFLYVAGLDRFPQLPASFIVADTVYRINYVRDYTFSVTGSTASFVLDEATPWPFGVFSYNESICFRDVGLIIDSLSYDIVFSTNYNQRKAGLTYRQANAQVVIDDQLELTARAISLAHDLAVEALSGYPAAQSVAETSQLVLDNIIRNGVTFAPVLNFTNPPGLPSNRINAKALLIPNIDYIVDETVGWIAAQVLSNTPPFSTSYTYGQDRFRTNLEYHIEALIYDITYGGNSQTRLEGIRYWDGVGSAVSLQIPVGEQAQTAAALNYARYLIKQVILNLPPALSYSATPRITGTASDVTIQNEIEVLFAEISYVLVNGVSVAATEVLPDLNAYAYPTSLKTARTTLLAEKLDIQNGVIDFVDANANIYEVLMPGNRSMLGNDFTQINDLGYGVVTTNGGLAEEVSMFTYYCHISYYAVNGGQIRSVGGSSAHGNFALVAEGADPLEVPTPVSLYHDLAQGATVYAPSPTYFNSINGLILYVNNYSYAPLDRGELEVDHGLGSIYRYPIATAETGGDLPAGVCKLSLQSSEGAGIEGLAAIIADGSLVTIRQGTQTVLTGDVVDVAVRPSTGMVLRESPTVYRILQFDEYQDPAGSRTFTINIGSPAVITRASHGLQPDYQISLVTTGALPTGVNQVAIYYVLADGFTANSFRISETKRGTPISTSGTQSGVHSYFVEGLARTTLRENYNYVDLSIWPSQPYLISSQICTVSIASPAVITLAGHGFIANDVIRFETNGALPSGIIADAHYFVKTVLGPNTFTVTRESISGSVAADTTGSQSGTHRVGRVSGIGRGSSRNASTLTSSHNGIQYEILTTGTFNFTLIGASSNTIGQIFTKSGTASTGSGTLREVGNSTFAVVPLGGDEKERVLNSLLVWKGLEYEIVAYNDENITGQAYATVTLNQRLVDSVIYFTSLPSLKSAVPKDEPGTLTIRIGLTRVTSHDLLDIGTGSYADTNYPNEIFGPPVNAYNPGQEVQERGVGRVFYVTTDQFGNFSVGPYFRVDQGTGTVTFAASIALSNLDGLGFKRGVPISEFSTDSGMSDNATDSVPTENATRTYIDRRLGVSHTGAIVPNTTLIPSISGGFMSLDGQLSMKANMDLGDFKITNVGDATSPKDAINLRSMTFANFQDADLSNVKAADILTFTGAGNIVQNSTVVGDISFNIDSTANTVDAQIVPGVITNTDINAAAAIVQSKLSMTAASTRANATGITQADRGLSSFDDAQFTATNGWITVKNNGLTLDKLAQIATKTVVGNSSLAAADPAAVAFTTVVNDGGAVKKSQYNTGTGYLRRIGFTATQDTDYTVVDEASANVVSTLVKRDSNGDFGARNVSVERLLVDTKIVLDTTSSATGGYTQVHGFNSQVGILIGDGSLATDKRNFYDNDGHTFRTQNGLSNAPIICSSVQATTLTTGATSTVGNITGDWRLGAGSKWQATYADLAEYYEGDKTYEVGTVLIFGGDKEVTTGTIRGDHRVAGVVSEHAAFIMNEGCQGNKVLIALQGRVPARVVGKIKKGDLIITSGIPGVGVSASGEARAGTIIGKALVDYDSDHIGTIEVAVGRT